MITAYDYPFAQQFSVKAKTGDTVKIHFTLLFTLYTLRSLLHFTVHDSHFTLYALRFTIHGLCYASPDQ